MMPLLPVGTIVVLVAGLAILAGWLAFRSASRCGRRSRVAITACRVLGMATLAIPLLNFGEWVTPSAESEASWLVLLDGSGSMGVEDESAGSRWKTAVQQLETFAESSEAPLQVDRFDRWTEPLELEALQAVEPDGDGTRLAGTLEESLRRRAGEKLRGILLLTDGRATEEETFDSAILLARAAEAPVHGWVFGEPVIQPNLELRLTRRQYTAFPGQDLKVEADLIGEHLPLSEVTVRLLDADGELVTEEKVRLPEGSSQERVALSVPELADGRHRFALEVDPLDPEQKTGDNRGEVTVHVLEEAVRVLLVEGAPYWDTKFIAQLLQREKGFAFELIYRLSEDRFFRLDGLEETEESGAARQVFLATAEALAEYDVVVFGKNVETFLDPAKARLLRDWVTEQGGALLLARGKPFSSPVETLDALFPMQWDTPWRQSYQWQPTFAGEDNGLFGGVLPGRESDLWSRLPELNQAVYGDELAPFTQVLVEGVSRAGGAGESRRFPAVVSRRIGDGYVVSIQSGDLWRWDFIPQVEEARSIYRDFWLQLFHWMVAYSEFLPGKEVALHLSETVIGPGQSVRARVLQRGAAAESGLQPILVRTNPDGSEVPMALIPETDREQAWESIFSLEQPGAYSFTLAPAGSTDPADRVYAQLEVQAPPGEMDRLDPDPETVARLVEATGGTLLDSPEALAAILNNVEPPPTPDAGNAEWQSRWDTPWVLLLLLGFFAAEWIIRRREGFI